MKVRDVMATKVVSVGPDARVDEVARLLLKHRISAVLVMDDAGRLLGIVSEGDLMRRAETGTERIRPWWLRLFSDPAVLASDYAKSHGLRARDVMSHPPLTIGGSASLNEAATLLETNRIKRLPVMLDGLVIGVVSRANLVQALASTGTSKTPAETGDSEIREQLMAELAAQPWSSAAARNVIVERGVVHLWGLLASEEERAATRAMAERISGTRVIQDHMIVRPLVMIDA